MSFVMFSFPKLQTQCNKNPGSLTPLPSKFLIAAFCTDTSSYYDFTDFTKYTKYNLLVCFEVS